MADHDRKGIRVNVGELRAMLDRLPDTAIVLVSGYEGGFAPATAGELDVQQLDRGDADWLGSWDTLPEAERAITAPLPMHDAAVPVGDPQRALVLWRSGR